VAVLLRIAEKQGSGSREQGAGSRKQQTVNGRHWAVALRSVLRRPLYMVDDDILDWSLFRGQFQAKLFLHGVED
jgi:hypothetical protein